MSYLDSRLPARFWSKTVVRSNTGCWLWTAALHDHGYGMIRVNRRTVRAHRMAYEALVGVIPHGLELDHKCRTRRCVNPEHLEAVTHDENMRRSSFIRAACPHGHAYTDDNSYFYVNKKTGNPVRYCRVCNRESCRRRYAARRAGDFK